MLNEYHIKIGLYETCHSYTSSTPCSWSPLNVLRFPYNSGGQPAVREPHAAIQVNRAAIC
jgi:hypothetical protein